MPLLPSSSTPAFLLTLPFFLTLTLLLLSLVSTTPARAPNPLIEYTFTSGDCSINRFETTPNSILSDYPLTFGSTQDASRCRDGGGVTSTGNAVSDPRLMSVKDLRFLKPFAADGDGITMEFYLKPTGIGSAADGAFFSLSTIAMPMSPDPNRCSVNGGYANYRMDVQTDGAIDVLLATSISKQTCTKMATIDSDDLLTNDENVHILLVTFSDNWNDLYINGEYRTSARGGHSFWNIEDIWTDSNRLMFFNNILTYSDMSDGRTFRGELYNFAMYAYPLSESEITQNYDASVHSFYTSSPSMSPTSSDYTRPPQAPSAAPSSMPIASPSVRPSQRPSVSPSVMPSRNPSARPSLLPSSSPSALSSSSPSEAFTRIPNPIVEFFFDKNECSVNSFASSPASLVPNYRLEVKQDHKVRCRRDALGVVSYEPTETANQGPRMVSSTSMADIKSNMIDGITIEMWLKPSTLDTVAHIFTLGSSVYQPSFGSRQCSSKSNGYFDIQITQQMNTMIIMIATQDYGCQTYSSNILSQTEPSHIVVVIKEYNNAVYINGVRGSGSTAYLNVGLINGDYHMHFFSDLLTNTATSGVISRPWSGELYLFAMYGRELTQPEIQFNFESMVQPPVEAALSPSVSHSLSPSISHSVSPSISHSLSPSISPTYSSETSPRPSVSNAPSPSSSKSPVDGEVRPPRTPGSIVETYFNGDECNRSSFTSSSTSLNNNFNIEFNQDNKVSCRKGGIGVTSYDSNDVTVEGPRMKSTSSIATLKPLIRNGITLEMWIKPSTLTSRSRLFTLGAGDYDPLYLPFQCSSRTRGYYDIQVIQNQNIILVMYVSYSGCQSVSSTLTTIDPVHLAFVMEDSKQVLYVNGIALSNAGNLNIRSDPWSVEWIQEDYYMHFFTDVLTNSNTTNTLDFEPYTGDIYLFSLYGHALQQHEVNRNFDSRAFDMPPIMSEGYVTINEDGEHSPGMYHVNDPAWYNVGNIVNSELLPIVDLNGLAFDADGTFSSFPDYDALTSMATLRLSRIPTTYQLYQLNGFQITNTSTIITNNKLRIRPGKDKFGLNIYTLDVTGFDIVTGIESEAVGKMHVTVTAVNDPPRPSMMLTSNINVGIYSILTLTGIDIEGDTFVAYAGGCVNCELYQVLPSGVVDVNARIIHTRELVSNLGVKVGVIFSGVESTSTSVVNGEGGIVGTASFMFTLEDANRSIESTFNINVYSSLKSQPSTTLSDYTVKEDILSNVILRGNDETQRVLRYIIESLPLHGTLYDLTDVGMTHALKVGDALVTTDSYSAGPGEGEWRYRGVAVKYLSDKDYFNFPTFEYDGTSLTVNMEEYFSYSTAVASTVGSDSKVSAETLKSLTVRQNIRVVNVNDPTTMTVPDVIQEVYANTLASRINSNLDGSKRDGILYFTSDPQSDRAIMVGNDADQSVDMVVIHISTTGTGGTISLNTNVLIYTEFNNCDSTFKRVGCKSDGSSTDHMTFKALPRDLNLIFGGLMYENNQGDTNDVITITVYDGSVPSLTKVTDPGFKFSCLPEELHKSNSDRLTTGCLMTENVINVKVNTLIIVNDKDKEGVMFLGTVLPLNVLFGMVGGMLALVCGCIALIKIKITKQSKADIEASRQYKFETSKEAALRLNGDDIEMANEGSRSGGGGERKSWGRDNSMSNIKKKHNLTAEIKSQSPRSPRSVRSSTDFSTPPSTPGGERESRSTPRRYGDVHYSHQSRGGGGDPSHLPPRSPRPPIRLGIVNPPSFFNSIHHSSNNHSSNSNSSNSNSSSMSTIIPPLPLLTPKHSGIQPLPTLTSPRSFSTRGVPGGRPPPPCFPSPRQLINELNAYINVTAANANNSGIKPYTANTRIRPPRMNTNLYDDDDGGIVEVNYAKDNQRSLPIPTLPLRRMPRKLG